MLTEKTLKKFEEGFKKNFGHWPIGGELRKKCSASPRTAYTLLSSRYNTLNFIPV